MSCLINLSEGHDIFPIRKNEIDTSSGSCGTTFPCTGKASVKRKNRPPCVKGALPEGRWGIVRQAGGYNPSVTCGATSLYTREASVRRRHPHADRRGCRPLRWSDGKCH